MRINGEPVMTWGELWAQMPRLALGQEPEMECIEVCYARIVAGQ